MHIDIDGVVIAVPLEVETAGADAIEAYVAEQLAQSRAASAPSSPPQE